MRLGQVDSAIASLNLAIFFYHTLGNTARVGQIQEVVASLERCGGGRFWRFF